MAFLMRMLAEGDAHHELVVARRAPLLVEIGAG
jgi:hypothetical protein